MQCPNCGWNNRANAKFCAQCGNAIQPAQPGWLNTLAGGRYKFIKRLSFHVCAAEDIDGEMVVIKRSYGGPDFPYPTYDNPRNEVPIHSKLNHPNIVKLIRWHDEPDRPPATWTVDPGDISEIIGKSVRWKDEESVLFIVTQYLSGEPLARRFFLRPGEQEEVLSLLWQMTDAVAYLHEMGVIHRDITPENVIVIDSKAFLIDFGFAAEFSPDNPPYGMGIMTMRYTEETLRRQSWLRPPEIGKRWFPASDVFYLGIAGIFMLTGKLLIQVGPNSSESQVKKALDILPTLNPTVSSDFLEVLRKATSWEIGRRFQNGSEMLVALEEVKKNINKR